MTESRHDPMHMVEGVQRGEEPFDELTELTAQMTAVIDEEKYPQLKGIIFLSDEATSQGGIQMFGYDDDSEGLADLFLHLKAMFTSMGKEFGVMTDQGVMLIGKTP